MNSANDIVKYAATVLVTIVISMTGFWMMMGRNYVTRTEANEIAVQRIGIIDTKLDLYLQSSNEIKIIITQNTSAINEFRVQSAKLNQTLLFLQDQIRQENRNNQQSSGENDETDTNSIPTGQDTD